jgi:hypothetical protein
MMERSAIPDPERDEILEPELEPAERKRLLETARLLERERPVPRPAFRGKLARRLRARSPSPQRLRVLIGAYAGAGLALLAVVAVGLAGAGPLAPG